MVMIIFHGEFLPPGLAKKGEIAIKLCKLLKLNVHLMCENEDNVIKLGSLGRSQKLFLNQF